jgi:succinate-semialdehyde dehydrogenase / glutarate-semialdehyde dehydrogenase
MYPSPVLYIGGAVRAGGRRRLEPILNPATGSELASLSHADAGDLEDAIDSATKAFRGWSVTSAFDRYVILRRAADLLLQRVELIARAITLEQGKPLAEARHEVAVSANVIDWYAEEGRRAYGRIIPGRNSAVRQMVLAEPVGPAVAFTPWNFPVFTPAHKVGAALAAGCSLILKAAEETPAGAVELLRAFHDAGLPPGVLNLVFGVPSEISTYFIRSKAVSKISFTGSTAVGRQLMSQAGAELKRTTMELGGHAPVIVLGDVDPAPCAALLAAGKFRNAGQTCISPSRYYVHESIYEEFVRRFVAYTNTLTVGDGLDEKTTLGPLANSRRVDAMERFVADARTRGGRLRAGGERRGGDGYYFAPTIVTDVADDALLMTHEPFGPIAPIVPFADLDQALTRANSLPFGLAAYAFTTSNALAARLANDLKAGMVGINTLAVSAPETPFGGVRDSGHGQEGGVEGLEAYLNLKLVAHAQ